MTEFLDVLNGNGEYTNHVSSREECHEKGLWHKAVVVFIIDKDNNNILLQQRSASKKLWPNMWDITAGGHVLTKELGYQAVIRETKEEIGINLNKEELEFIGATSSENTQGKIINKHFNEYYVVHKDVDINDIKLQDEEVQDIKWIDKKELISMINNDYQDLTKKYGCWQYLLKYFEFTKQ